MEAVPLSSISAVDCARALVFQAGLIFQTPWSLHLHTRSSQVNAWEPFFLNPTGGGGGCTPWAGCFFSASTAAVPAAPVETASDDQLLTLPPPRTALGGEPCGELPMPLDPDPLQQTTYLARCVQRVPYTVNSLTCIDCAMYLVINQYCLSRCLYYSYTCPTLPNS
jgi:hypothetical protein